LFFYLGPWKWISDDIDGDRYEPPPTTQGVFDLASVVDQGTSGRDRKVGLFATTERQPSEYNLLGKADGIAHVPATTKIRDAFFREAGYRPQGTNLCELVVDFVTNGGDPLGQSRCKPIVPTAKRWLVFSLCGHKALKKKFVWGKDHSAIVQKLIQEDFREVFLSGPESDHYRKVLDFWAKKYGVDWRELVPRDLKSHVKPPLPHETTINESFNKADGDPVGPDLTWTETVNSSFISSNQIHTHSNPSLCRAEHDLSSDDHYGQLDYTNDGSASGSHWNWAAPTVRHSASADTCYWCFVRRSSGTASAWRTIRKRVSGTNTSLVSTLGTTTLYYPEEIKLQVDGSDLELFRNSVSQLTVTDTAITGNTRCGTYLRKHSAPTDGPYGDDFEAADLATGGATVPVMEHHYRMQRLGS